MNPGFKNKDSKLNALSQYIERSDNLSENRKASLTRTVKETVITLETLRREVKIVMALEKVRRKAMRMQKSEQLIDVATVLSKQLISLGISHFSSCGFALIDEKNNTQKLWGVRTKTKLLEESEIPLLGDSILKARYEAWKRRDPVFSQRLGGQKLKKHLETSYPVLKRTKAEKIATKDMPDPTFFYFGNFSHGYLQIIATAKLNEDATALLSRFTRVVEMVYRRFQDLKKAEAQAREAQIEAALERVRSRSIAMQKSDELKELVHTLSVEIGKLDIIFNRTFIIIYATDTLGSTWWMSNPESNESFGLYVKYHELYPYQEFLKSWRLRKPAWLYILEGKDKKEWDKLLFTETVLALLSDHVKNIMQGKEKVFLSSSFANFGYLTLESSEPLTEEQFDILFRFAKVFDLTYARFLNIQKAENQAREALKQSSLDRVRGQIASMRNKEDLNRITPVIWEELKSLNVPFIRCGVFIVNDQGKNAQVYLSSPGGHSLAAVNLGFDSSDLIRNIVESWRTGKIYKEHWNRDQFIRWTQSLIESGHVQSQETYQGAEKPPESLNLHFVPFKQGMLYIGNTNPLSEDELDLVKSLAEAFSIAYARYEDFTELEKAKRSIEKTLNELKATQSQLIYAEKMASLGELTAGIAHEIQNPLNFVNNFSEVSNEMIDELKAERSKLNEKRNEKLENEIILDVGENLQKIGYHGHRASDIIKSMLQHSRMSTGEKELTNINDLCDEYLRLAYHGMRTKDKSFNAEYRLELDPDLPKVNVVPQDIGRVLLNLINNAFHAITQSSKLEPGRSDYKPEVVVNTRKLKEIVEIRVKDNGPGIPHEIRDKIFQPFFTTKPAGQGTGLGLSLSYDIVKAHGGELRVESKHNEGTDFTIGLDLNSF